MRLLTRLRALFGKPKLVQPKWRYTVKAHCTVHPPRTKPRSWSQKFYDASKWSRNRVSVRMDDVDVAAVCRIHKAALAKANSANPVGG